ncbi:uncharacterized protein [Physcomitrium patens]|uniref:Uncharacterized protein n=1 Tax=Physcomitrium patens TaxID=3218 RepID=A0A2K1KEW8_PHYPA|nr:trafficking protein particle complex subunit 8-like [Physcomitrium patens]PNR52320.1 hypothetical protein PHYPA_008694 [Physcomitrium patens]|eukprot:XP_024378593.1 trafficking protein particle complex subunit 8-like [Physcomitrella patens]
MDPAETALAQLLRQRMSPVVMVMATARAEETSRKNQLGIVDLLRPFCVLDQIDVPVRTASELPYRLQDFELRMFYAADIAQPSAEVAEDYLVQCVSDASDEAAAALLGDSKDIEVVRKMVESETQSSWFQRYCRDYIRTLAFSEHEAIDHPIACLLVASTKDESPLTQFVDLYNPDFLPTLVKDGAMDPKVLKHYVLLHDVQDGSLDESNKILSEMRSTFGAINCGVLSINSGSIDSDSLPNDVWSGRLLQPIVNNSPELKQVDDTEAPKQRPGLCLSKSDVAMISDFVLDFALKQIIPHMEQKIRILNQQVSATRRGLKNQLKNLWWRKGKEETSDVQAGGQYTFSSMESQIRVLADYAFMLHDYDLALQNYRLLSSDYKTDKAWKRYAGVQEMIGLCLFMMDQSRREAEISLESAYNVYQKCGGNTAKYATRTSMWLAEIHKARGQFREAANVLFRASMLKIEGGQGVSLRAGVLLEQAAYCYLRLSPPMLRKFGFHMVLAGNRYTVCFQRKHAMRVYRSVLSIFEGQGWKYISDHVHFHLGRLSHFLGNNDLAIFHFMKLVTCSHQSPANQSNFLREFLYVVENTVGKNKVLDLELPTINAERVHVHFEDHRIYSTSSAAAKAENIWTPVEEGLVPSVAVQTHTWMDAPKSLVQAIDYNVCIAGEEVGVDVEFSNPLQIPIDVSSVCLTCEFDDSSVNKPDTAQIALNPSEDQSSDLIEDKAQSTVITVENDSMPSVVLPDESFQLPAAEKIVVRLKAKPLKEGVLKVVGVRWVLAGIATGHREFTITGPQITTSKTRAWSNPPPNQRLKFHVLAHMPRLEVSMHEPPMKVNTGELHRVVLELYNPSKISVKRIKFKTSHPNVLLVGKAEDLDMEFPSCLEVQAGQEGGHELKHVDIAEFKKRPSVFSFPEDTLLEGGSTVLWPLWLHARQPGTLSLNSILYYESDSANVGLKYRTVRMTESIQVVPSLKVSVQISPSPLHLQQFFLRLDVKNQNALENFWLRQVSCSGDRWCLAPLLPPVLDKEGVFGKDSEDNVAFLSSSVCASQLLPASQTLSLFFKLNVAQREGKSNTDEVSNIGLGPPSSREPLIDIASGPLADFLMLEKLHQPRPPLPYFLKAKKSAVEESSDSSNILRDGGEVDVVLISEQQEGLGDAAVQNPSLRVGAHHICHCSVQGDQPFVWVMEGPNPVYHNFSRQPFCEVTMLLTIRNCSIYTGSIRVETLDLVTPASTPASPKEIQFGWIPLSTSASPVGDPVTANVVADPASSKQNSNSVAYRTPTPPFLWCNLRSTTIHSLAPGASTKVPLRVAFLAPGVYDLSRYRISWTLLELLQSTVAEGLSEMSELHLKTTSATYSRGFTPPVDTSLQTGSHETSDASASGVGLGHSLLLSVVQSNT